MDNFPKVLFPLTFADFQEIYKTSENIDFQQSFLEIKECSLNFEITFKENVDFSNFQKKYHDYKEKGFFFYIKYIKITFKKKKEIKKIYEQCLKPDNIFSIHDEPINKLILKEEEKILISSNETLCDLSKRKNTNLNQTFYKGFFTFVSFVKIQRKFCGDEYILLQELLKNSELFAKFEEILMVFNKPNSEILLFFWRGEENTVFEMKEILEKKAFFKLILCINENELILRIKKQIFNKCLSEKYKCHEESKAPLIFSHKLRKFPDFPLDLDLENYFSLNIYKSYESTEESIEHYVEKLSFLFSNKDFNIFVDVNRDTKKCDFLPKKGNFIGINILATHQKLYEFFKNKHKVISHLLKGESLFLFC